MRSPGKPSLRGDVERLFWRRIAAGLSSEEAALAVGRLRRLAAGGSGIKRTHSGDACRVWLAGVVVAAGRTRSRVRAAWIPRLHQMRASHHDDSPFRAGTKPPHP
jgi:hypothetical protein